MIHDDLVDEIEILEALNEELNSKNIVVLDSEQEEESAMENEFNNMQMDTLEEDNIEVLRNLFTGSMTQSLSSLFLHPTLDFSPTSTNDTFSRVLGDGFHFVDRIKVPMHHSYKKSYYVSLREAFFAWNPTIHAKVNIY